MNTLLIILAFVCLLVGIVATFTPVPPAVPVAWLGLLLARLGGVAIGTPMLVWAAVIGVALMVDYHQTFRRHEMGCARMYGGPVGGRHRPSFRPNGPCGCFLLALRGRTGGRIPQTTGASARSAVGLGRLYRHHDRLTGQSGICLGSDCDCTHKTILDETDTTCQRRCRAQPCGYGRHASHIDLSGPFRLQPSNRPGEQHPRLRTLQRDGDHRLYARHDTGVAPAGLPLRRSLYRTDVQRGAGSVGGRLLP